MLLKNSIRLAAALAHFYELHQARFGDADVPLLRSLDLLSGLAFPPPSTAPTWTPRDDFLLRQLEDAWSNSHLEVRIDPARLPRAPGRHCR